jgi:hypothetical protein
MHAGPRLATAQRAIADALTEAAIADPNRALGALRDRQAEIAMAEANTCEQQAKTYNAEATRFEREIETLKTRELAQSPDARR